MLVIILPGCYNKKVKTVIDSNTFKLEINKSIFIAILFHINNKDDFLNKLKQIKNEYKGAKHYCYSYVLHGIAKNSDDGEPSQTAGKPIEKTLIDYQLNNCAIVVVRYFGGRLLGANILARTYLSVSKSVVEKTKLVDIINAKMVTIYDLNYAEFDILKKNQKKYSFCFKNIVYSDTINLDIISNNEIIGILTNLLNRTIKTSNERNIEYIMEDEK